MKKLIPILALFLIVFVGVISFRQPTHNLVWAEEYSEFPAVVIENNQVTISGVRDWRYKDQEISSKDFTSKNFSIDDVKEVWFIVEPFGKWDGVAHTYFTFDFHNAEPISLSVEARREKEEVYSPFRGLFNKYELIYQWGTEEDLLVRRAVYLKNKTIMYPLQITDSEKKVLLKGVLEETQSVEKQPRFYNTLTSNCTNNLAKSVNALKAKTIPFTTAFYVTGYADNLLYKLQYIPHHKPFPEIEQQFDVTTFVQQNYREANFSELLREELGLRQ